MRFPLGALLMTATLFTGHALAADKVYTVGKVIILGSKTVPVAQLMAVVQEHKGSKVTVNDIIADRDAISKVLESAHVVGSVAPTLATADGISDVTFTVDDQGVQAPVVTTVNPKLDAETFVGNIAISSDDLATASGLKPGDELTNAKIATAQLAIQAAYKALKSPVNANISGQNTRLANGTYDVVWHITESAPAPAKKAPPAPSDTQ